MGVPRVGVVLATVLLTAGLGSVAGAEHERAIYLVDLDVPRWPQVPPGGPVPLDPATGAFLAEDDLARAAEVVARHGGAIAWVLRMTPTIAALLPTHEADALAREPGVLRVQAPRAGTADSMVSQREATRWNALQTVGGAINHHNLPYAGRGVGIGVIDTGLDSTHPDLPYDVLGRRLLPATVLDNYLPFAVGIPHDTSVLGLRPAFFLRAPATTDAVSSHGTAVTGIIAGQPGLLDEVQHGVAPGSKITAWSGGAATTLLDTWVANAQDHLLWLLDHGATAPRIRVASYSWSFPNPYDPNFILHRQMGMLLDRGVTVVVSAANAGGDGSEVKTNPACQVPRVVCVGAYDDGGTGTRNGAVAGFSSRGAASVPESWPDLVAPGVRVDTTRALLGLPKVLVNVNDPTSASVHPGLYYPFGGTSAAAPFVAGSVALMQEARSQAGKAPLTPEQAGNLLRSTAYRFPSGAPYPNFAAGHGLLDVEAAVRAAAAL